MPFASVRGNYSRCGTGWRCEIGGHAEFSQRARTFSSCGTREVNVSWYDAPLQSCVAWRRYQVFMTRKVCSGGFEVESPTPAQTAIFGVTLGVNPKSQLRSQLLNPTADWRHRFMEPWHGCSRLAPKAEGGLCRCVATHRWMPSVGGQLTP
jgi:hypothetical protein